jgi:hypothetical protein
MPTITDEPIVSLRSYHGEMPKPIYEMTDSERKAYYEAASVKARDYLFSIGQSLVYRKNGQMVSESADGSIKILP